MKEILEKSFNDKIEEIHFLKSKLRTTLISIITDVLNEYGTYEFDEECIVDSMMGSFSANSLNVDSLGKIYVYNSYNDCKEEIKNLTIEDLSEIVGQIKYQENF